MNKGMIICFVIGLVLLVSPFFVFDIDSSPMGDSVDVENQLSTILFVSMVIAGLGFIIMAVYVKMKCAVI